MDPRLKALADAPLADPLGINLPMGKRRAPRVRIETDDIGGEKLTRAQLQERRDKALWAKHDKLLDYYATVDISAETVAAHINMPVDKVAEQLAWRRKRNAGE